MKEIASIGLLLCSLLIACTPLNPSEMTCEQLGTEVVGMVLKFGLREDEILKMYAPTELNRNSDELNCEGEAMFSSGARISVQMRAWTDEDGDAWINVETVR